MYFVFRAIVMEQKYDTFVPEFLFDELPYYVKDKLAYMGIWDKYITGLNVQIMNI